MSISVEEITDRNIPSVDKFIVALKYLNQGRELKIDGIRFKVAEHATGEGFGIVQVATYKNSLTEEVKDIVLGVPVEFFISRCYSLTDQELMVMKAEIAFQGTKKGR